MEKILVLDFGGQYNRLIACRVREQHEYAEIKPYNQITLDEIKKIGYRGIIFTGEAVGRLFYRLTMGTPFLMGDLLYRSPCLTDHYICNRLPNML
ncbi:MAG: hypothetical protein IJW55_00375 [Clostridia bacterium]|nr:hypothetical protein [Clostridia bacterium]